MPKENDDWNVELSDKVKDQIAEDPKLAVALQDLTAIFHQAIDGVKRGQYKSMEDAMEALTGSRPEKIDPDTGEAIPGASLSRDMGLDDE